MIDDIGGAIFVGMVLAVILSFIWALAEAAQRKDLEKQVRILQLKLSQTQQEKKNLQIKTDFLEIFKED